MFGSNANLAFLSPNSACFLILRKHNSFARQLVDKSDNKTELIGKISWYFDLAHNVQPEASIDLSFAAINYLTDAPIFTN